MRLIGGETSQEQEIFAAYSMGMTPLEIAQHLQLKETEVRKALKGALSKAEETSAWVAPQ